MRRKLIAGNWKMNGRLASGRGLARDLVAQLADRPPACDYLICPPFHLLRPVAEELAALVAETRERHPDDAALARELSMILLQGAHSPGFGQQGDR